MKTFSKTKSITVICLILLSILVVLPLHVSATSATLYLSPGSKTVSQGSTLSISVRVNANGNAVNAVQANLSYPTSKFDFISSSCSSTFSVTAQASGGGGSVQLACGLLGSVTGDSLVGIVNLRAKVSSGTASVTFAGGSNVASSGGNVTGATTGGTYSFTTPPVQAPKDTTAPKISSIAINGVSYHAATVTWKTDEASSSIVEYGLTSNFGLTAQTSGQATDHSVNLPSDTLVPGTQYYYRVTSADASGNTSHSSQATFSTTGIAVEIIVQTNKSKPVKGAEVKFIIEGTKSQTDQNGTAKFSDIKPGKYAVAINYNGGQTNGVIEVKDSNDSKTFDANNYGNQKFTLTYTGVVANSQRSILLTVLITLTSVVVAGIGAVFGYRWYRFRSYKTFAPVPNTLREQTNDPTLPKIDSITSRYKRG